MLTDGKPTNLIKTHALLSQNRQIEKALPIENVSVFPVSSPTRKCTHAYVVTLGKGRTGTCDALCATATWV